MKASTWDIMLTHLSLLQTSPFFFFFFNTTFSKGKKQTGFSYETPRMVGQVRLQEEHSSPWQEPALPLGLHPGEHVGAWPGAHHALV